MPELNTFRQQFIPLLHLKYLIQIFDRCRTVGLFARREFLYFRKECLSTRRKRVVIGSGGLCALIYAVRGTPFQGRFNVSKALSVARLVLKLIFFFGLQVASQEIIGCHLHIHAYPIQVIRFLTMGLIIFSRKTCNTRNTMCVTSEKFTYPAC